jgi:transcriptional regulator with XRE-family HTH domain
MANQTSIGSLVRQARQDAGLSILATASASGVSESTISRLERGGATSVLLAEAVLTALGRSLTLADANPIPLHYLASVCGHTSKEWHRVGTAVQMPDEDFVRVHIPLGAKPIFLHRCTSEEAAPDGVPLPRPAP